MRLVIIGLDDQAPTQRGKYCIIRALLDASSDRHDAIGDRNGLDT